MIDKNEEPFKEIIDPMIKEIMKRKEVFNREYDDSPIYKDLRWQTTLEGHFFDQLYKFSHNATAEQIGEYVIEFFNIYDTNGFDVEEESD